MQIILLELYSQAISVYLKLTTYNLLPIKLVEVLCFIKVLRSQLVGLFDPELL